MRIHPLQRFWERFPLVELELRRTARRRDTYSLRLVAIGIVVVPLGCMLFLSWYLGEDLVVEPAAAGRALGWQAVVIQAFTAIVFTTARSSAALITEKQDRTLGLLVMADLRGWDIILAKFLAVYVRTIMGMLTAVPFVAFAAALGGINLEAYLWLSLSLAIYGAATTGLGIYFSTRCAQSNVAITLTSVTIHDLGRRRRRD